ncbi:MAG: Polymyxin resistance protein ArnC, glycosyl transferase [Bacteriovoracaceae bacterium]|nr:Polymyxin resistance protein ArnC, glycosyl transferase [Bacteriovoracaceae bacterium]
MRAITGIPFLDTQCGFKLIRGDLARKIGDLQTENRFAFDVELVLLAHKLGATVSEVPVEWAHQESSRVVVWRDGIQMASRVVVLAGKWGRWK